MAAASCCGFELHWLAQNAGEARGAGDFHPN
jgi:hypothetical protein